MGVFSIFREPGKKSDPAKVKIPSREAYYETIARRISFAKYALILLSVCFAAFAFTFYGDELTIENFRYMLKFVSFDPVTVGSDGSRVVYDYDAGNLGAPWCAAIWRWSTRPASACTISTPAAC